MQIPGGSQRQLQGLHQHRRRRQQEDLLHTGRQHRQRLTQRPDVQMLWRVMDQQPLQLLGHARPQFHQPQPPAALQQAAPPLLGDAFGQGQ
jgi:hypothetical protein